MDRRRFLAGVGTAAATGLAGCLASGEPDLGPNEVGMTTRRFEPDRLTVAVGTTVTWHNTDRGVHTVTAYGDGIPEEADYFASGGYDSEDAAREAWLENTGGGVQPDSTVEHTFEVSGTYSYVCLPHEQAGMVGTVVVE